MQKQPSKSEEIIAKLMYRHKAGFDFTLRRMQNLLAKLGNPQDYIAPVIHIAGTNGKGSVAAFCRSLIEASGKKVNVHISPHLVNWQERFRINGKLIEDEILAELIKDIAKIADKDVTIFEILTTCAMILFQKYPSDYTILEVGLGGRLDATNVITKPACSIITPISYDHCAILGNSLSKIAQEKAEIIKNSCPCVFAPQQEEILELLINKANSCSAPYFAYGEDFTTYYKKKEQQCPQFIWQDQDDIYKLDLPKLPGQHQIINAACAIKAVKLLLKQLSPGLIQQGLNNVYWPGRLQKITSGKLYKELQQIYPGLELWIDGAHNEAGAEILVDFFKDKKLHIICGMLSTKNAENFLQILKQLNAKFYFTPISDSNCIEPAQLAKYAQNNQIKDIEICHDIANSLERISTQLQDDDIILLTGSLHLVGEFLEANHLNIL